MIFKRRRLMIVLTMVVAMWLVRPTYGIEMPETHLVNRISYFMYRGEAHTDTLVTVGWRRLSIARGVDFGIIGSGRYDSTNTTSLIFDEFVRNEREPTFSVDELSLTLELAQLWPASEWLFGGAVKLQLGKFLFPMFGVGDVVRLNDVFVPHNFAHNPVVRDPADPTADERLPQYGVHLSWGRRLNASNLRFRLEAIWAPVFVPNRYASYGPWRIVPIGAAVENDLPAVGSFGNGQQSSGRACVVGSDYGAEFCLMGYVGHDQTPFTVSAPPAGVRLVYGKLHQYGASLSTPLPFSDDVIVRLETAFADYRPAIGTDAISASATVETARVLRDRELFVLIQGMWRNVGTRNQPLHEVLYRGVLGRVRYGSLLDARDWAVQLEAGVNADPIGFVIQPAIFFPMPSFLGGLWEKTGISAPRLELRYVLFGGEAKHVFGEVYRERDHVLVGIRFNQ